MSKIYLAGLGAGLVCAIAFASATGGHPLGAFVLFLLAPLPVYLVGLGFGGLAVVAAALSGGVFLGLFTGPLVALLFAATQILPAGVLSWLALLRRDSLTPGGSVMTEWYPPGRLVMWAGIIAAAMAIGMMLILGQDMEALKTGLRAGLEKYLKDAMPQTDTAPAMSDADLDRLTDVTLSFLPAVTAMSMMLAMLLNLWVAGRVATASGALARPWPDLAAVTLPAGAPLVLAGSVIAATVLEGIAGLAASAAAGAAYLAFVLVGLAIVHFTSRGRPLRGLILGATYACLIVFNTGFSMILAIMGLTEPFSPLRRSLPPDPPPGPPSGPPIGPT
ncbi:MAG: DUF2232 domain-containing protein [Hyphomicrobiaceae bacterium]|nr:DUF2232 domain-containing protein [Hyphomicrobiaceae bacterium]